MTYKKELSLLIDKRKEEMTNKAFKVFAEKGIFSTSMEDLAKTCSAGVASLYRYFGSKKGMLVFLATKKTTEFFLNFNALYLEILNKGLSGKNELLFALKVLGEKYFSDKRFFSFKAEFELYAVREKLSTIELKPYYAALKPFYELLKSMLLKGNIDGSIKKDLAFDDLVFYVLAPYFSYLEKLSLEILYPTELVISNDKILSFGENLLLKTL